MSAVDAENAASSKFMEKLSNLFIFRFSRVRFSVVFTFRFLLNLAATIFHNFAVGINQRWGRRRRAEGYNHVSSHLFWATVLQSPHAGESDTVFIWPPCLQPPRFYYFFLPTKAGKDPEENVAKERGERRRVRAVLEGGGPRWHCGCTRKNARSKEQCHKRETLIL